MIGTPPGGHIFYIFFAIFQFDFFDMHWYVSGFYKPRYAHSEYILGLPLPPQHNFWSPSVCIDCLCLKEIDLLLQSLPWCVKIVNYTRSHISKPNNRSCWFVNLCSYIFTSNQILTFDWKIDCMIRKSFLVVGCYCFEKKTIIDRHKSKTKWVAPNVLVCMGF